MKKSLLLLIAFIIISGCNDKNSQSKVENSGDFKGFMTEMAEAQKQSKKNQEQRQKDGYIEDVYDPECPIKVEAFNYDTLDNMKYQIKLKDESKKTYANDNKIQWQYSVPDNNSRKKTVKIFEPLVDFNFVTQEYRTMKPYIWKRIKLMYDGYNCGSFIFPAE